MRRILDGSVALIAIILISPLLLLIAAVIVLVSPGNPFYLAPRVGKDGRKFCMWKFRTMIPGASQVGPSITGRGDPRIIPGGRYLRRSKLDALPQFANVLLGDMSLVGPRPEAPEIVALYQPVQYQVLSVKPGITGRVQLESGDESDSIPYSEKADEYYIKHLMSRKVDSDLAYIQDRTLAGDIRILLSTAVYIIRAIVRHRA
jgi:lipopolysaccharide/colanic/teichoic acid biosynthesis glycosyltransferase